MPATSPTSRVPISRTGLTVHYSPRFKVDAQPGAFHVEDDIGPFAEALRAPVPPAGPSAAPVNVDGQSAKRANQGAAAGASGRRVETKRPANWRGRVLLPPSPKLTIATGWPAVATP